MATQTRAELIDSVLINLGVLAAGQTANANDAAVVGRAIDSEYKTLRAERVAPFALSAIPEDAQMQLQDMVSWRCAQAFGINAGRRQELYALSAAALRELRRRYLPQPSINSVSTKSF